MAGNGISNGTSNGTSNGKGAAAFAPDAPMVIDSDDKPTRVGFRKDEDGRSIRVSRRTGKDL